MTSAFGTPSAQASALDLRPRFRPAGDQGPRGTCVAFAVTAIHEAERGVDPPTQSPDDLAEEVLFWGAKQIDRDSSSGTKFSSANLALQQWGQPAEALWPYDPRRNSRGGPYSPPAAAIDPTSCHFTELRPIPADLTEIASSLAGGRSVAIGIPVWDGLRLAEVEPLPAPTPDEMYPTRHAVVVVGINEGHSAILIRNSWGLRWGHEGHLWISIDVLQISTGAWVVDDTPTQATLAIEGEEVLS